MRKILQKTLITIQTRQITNTDSQDQMFISALDMDNDKENNINNNINNNNIITINKLAINNIINIINSKN